jgi:predicted porin
MIRKRLVTAIGALLMGGGIMAVQADSAMFGHFDASVVANDQGGGSDDQFFECTTCATGFRGSEDLGNGLQAILKLDSRHDISAVTSGGTLSGRDQWPGMANSFGQARAATISIVYQPHSAVIDPVSRSTLQSGSRGVQSNLHPGAGSSGEGRAENAARHDNPGWNGLKFAATYTHAPDSNPGVNERIDDDNGYGAGVSYENAGILLFADYMTNDAGGDDEAYKLGGKVTFSNFSLMGQYEIDDGLITSQAADTSGDGANNWVLGGTFTLGNNTLFASYGRADGGDLLGNYSSWTLAGTHSMSKRTKLYAGFNSIVCDNPDTNVCSKAADKGGEDEQFSLGMKHHF